MRLDTGRSIFYLPYQLHSSQRQYGFEEYQQSDCDYTLTESWLVPSTIVKKRGVPL